MKKYFIPAVVVLVTLTLVLSVFGQPTGNTAGGDRRGGTAMERAGGARGGMMGRGRQRPAREERLAAIKELEKQIAALKAAMEKAPEKDPNVAKLEGEELTKFMAQYTEESNAVNAIQQTLSSISGRRGGASADVLSELRVLADQEKASKTLARIDALIKEQQTSRGGRRSGTEGQGGQGGQRRGGTEGQGGQEGQRRGQQQ